jgi:hypothetical protein
MTLGSNTVPSGMNRDPVAMDDDVARRRWPRARAREMSYAVQSKEIPRGRTARRPAPGRRSSRNGSTPRRWAPANQSCSTHAGRGGTRRRGWPSTGGAGRVTTWLICSATAEPLPARRSDAASPTADARRAIPAHSQSRTGNSRMATAHNTSTARVVGRLGVTRTLCTTEFRPSAQDDRMR